MIIIGADHAGIELKNRVKEYLKNNSIEFKDITDNKFNENDDYPDIAIAICKEVLNNTNNKGIAICGTGLGISIACNKIKGIIATPCYNKYTAEMARKHNNSNVLCLGSRLEYSKKTESIVEIVDTFLRTNFEGERHLKRIEKIKQLENKFGENLWE